MDELESYYNEHASQARQHENQRERITSIILTVATILTGFITANALSSLAIIASISVSLLGMFGFLFAGKHYERSNFHTAIMKQIRNEIDRFSLNKEGGRASLQSLRAKGEQEHYTHFVWPKFSGTDSVAQKNAKSWIARQRTHVFWEMLHILVFLIGIMWTVAILSEDRSEKPPLKVEIIK